MLPRVQPYQNATGGDTNSGLFEDISTRSLLTVRVGESAGKISSGTANTFIGYEAGRVNTAGSFDTFIGYQAGALNTNANNSTFIGAFAGRENQRGSECVFIGFRSGELNRDGQSVVAVGSYAMRENVSGTGSVAIGWRAAERNLDGDYNTFVGTESGQDNRSGNMNTMCGFRSGRANFEGSENTYIGAYSGYSNRSGYANCLVGYKSGQNMEFGHCNVAIGAYTFEQGRNVSSSVAIGPFAGAQASSGSDCVYIGASAAANNSNGSQNVMIGVNSGRNNTRDRNVVIGYNAGENCSTTESVIIGAVAGSNMTANNSVIIGYKTASKLFGGTCNVFIGTGAAPYTSNANYSISIGTKNTFTSSHSITVGETIYNERAFSILMGFDLQSDADNSVIMGNTVKIQSVIFFKDPLNYFIQESVLNDATIKLGISNITYGCNASMLHLPEKEIIYTNAFAGVITSNIANSVTNRPSKATTTNFDLVQGSYSATVASGHAFAINDQSILNTNSNQYILPSTYVRSSRSLSPVPPSIQWKPSDYLRRHTCNVQVPMTTDAPGTTVIRNIRNFETPPNTPIDLAFWFPKRVRRPILPFSIESPLIIPVTTHVLTSTEAWQNLMQVSNITYTTDGIAIPNAQTKLIIDQAPAHITIDKGSYLIGETIRFKVHKDRSYASSDTFRVSILTEIVDETGRVYGVPGTQGDIRIEFVPSTQLTLYRQTFLNPSTPVALTSNHVHGIPPIPSNTLLNITYLDENCTLYLQHGARIVTSNVIQQLLDEDVYGLYSDGRYVTNISSLSNYMTQAYTSTQKS
jgi:hypothetical protein